VPPVSIENPMLIAWLPLNMRSGLHAERFANDRSGPASGRAAIPRDRVRSTGNLTA